MITPITKTIALITCVKIFVDAFTLKNSKPDNKSKYKQTQAVTQKNTTVASFFFFL